MIFLLTSTRPDLGGPCQIRLSRGGNRDNPYLGFVSEELRQAYLKFKNWGDDSFYVASIEDLRDEIDKLKDIIVLRDENQFQDIEKDPEGYEYEKYITQNAF